MWQVNILSLFPEIFPGPLTLSITGIALREKKWALNSYNIRDFATDKHKTVDDSSYGGGAGMVMKPDVLAAAIEGCFDLTMPIIY
ncbi:MAG: tRNA (guanosine(37)-N1)-methyltransferase TrmD, partial [Alphaproteobacteria bacterium]